MIANGVRASLTSPPSPRLRAALARAQDKELAIAVVAGAPYNDLAQSTSGAAPTPREFIRCDHPFWTRSS